MVVTLPPDVISIVVVKMPWDVPGDKLEVVVAVGAERSLEIKDNCELVVEAGREVERDAGEMGDEDDTTSDEVSKIVDMGIAEELGSEGRGDSIMVLVSTVDVLVGGDVRGMNGVDIVVREVLESVGDVIKDKGKGEEESDKLEATLISVAVAYDKGYGVKMDAGKLEEELIIDLEVEAAVTGKPELELEEEKIDAVVLDEELLQNLKEIKE